MSTPTEKTANELEEEFRIAALAQWDALTSETASTPEELEILKAAVELADSRYMAAYHTNKIPALEAKLATLKAAQA